MKFGVPRHPSRPPYWRPLGQPGRSPFNRLYDPLRWWRGLRRVARFFHIWKKVV